MTITRLADNLLTDESSETLEATRVSAGPGRYFHLTYSNAAPDDVHKLFKVRDGVALNELAAALAPLGYQYGTTIHFYPNDERALKEFPALHANDLLVLTTRPPLTDREAFSKPRKIILSSENDLEKLIFNQLFQHISYCTRKHINLTQEAQDRLTADASKWKSLEFYENSGATHPLGVAIIKKHLALPKKSSAAPTPPSPSSSAPTASPASKTHLACHAASWLLRHGRLLHTHLEHDRPLPIPTVRRQSRFRHGRTRLQESHSLKAP